MGKKSTPAPPDFGPMIQAMNDISAENTVLAREQMAWAREQDTANRATLERVLGVQLPIMEEQFRNAQEDRQRYEETYLPIEQNLIQEFQNYGSESRMNKERSRAIADVSTQFDAQRRNAVSRLESYGIDPSQTRNQALDLNMRIAQAATSAGAADAATQRVENTGRALRAEAINIGRGLPSQVAGSYGQSIAAGQAGVGGANQTTGTSTGALTSGTAFTGQAIQAAGQAGSFMNSQFNNGMAIANFNQAGMGQWMDLAGTVAGGAMAMQEGGIVPEAGALPASPIPGSTDRKPILATPGEAVVDLDTTRWYGEKFFADLKKKAGEQRMALEIQKRQPQGAIPVGA